MVNPLVSGWWGHELWNNFIHWKPIQEEFWAFRIERREEERSSKNTLWTWIRQEYLWIKLYGRVPQASIRLQGSTRPKYVLELNADLQKHHYDIGTEGRHFSTMTNSEYVDHKYKQSQEEIDSQKVLVKGIWRFESRFESNSL